MAEADRTKTLNDSGEPCSSPASRADDRLGLVRELVPGGLLTVPELARRTTLSQGYVRQWVRAATG
jgi:hypothetical protein